MQDFGNGNVMQDFGKWARLLVLIMTALILLGQNPCGPPPPMIDILTPNPGDQLPPCSVPFRADFDNVTPEELPNISIFLSDVKISGNGTYEIDGGRL